MPFRVPEAHRGLSCRLAESSDVRRLHALVNSAYRGESSKKGWTTEADFLDGQRIDTDRLLEMIANPKFKILVLVDLEGEVLSTVCLEWENDAKVPSVYLGMLTVNPESQTGGLGKIMMSEAEDKAREWGAERMTLGVINLREELMAWYERRGYRKTGETKPFPYGDERFGIPKREDMHFVMFEKPLV